MKITIFTSLLIALTISFGTSAKNLEFTQTETIVSDANYSEEVDDYLQLYGTIASVTVTEITDYADSFENHPIRLESGTPIGTIITQINSLIAVGKKIWAIIQNGKPVIHNQLGIPAISVLPRGISTEDEFSTMSNWSEPRYRKFRVEFENMLGMRVIGFTYMVSFQYDGTYEGKGRYLTGVHVSASNISVSWGFTFSAKSTLISIANRGSQDNPIASATMKINYSVSSVLRTISASEIFHITGTGKILKY